LIPLGKALAAVAVVMIVGIALLATGGEGPPVRVEIPAGATLPRVAQILEEHDVVGSARLFHAYARLRRADRELKAGTYVMPTGSTVHAALRRLTRGEVETMALTIPEGFRPRQIAPRIAQITTASEEEVVAFLEGTELVAQHELPGPTLEGYLFPDTYRFALGVRVATVVRAMVDRYERIWTPERRARLEASGLTEREVVTLASIIQAEARIVDEMPRISGVYHNRLDAGWRLEADPTVLYALGGYRERLLYAAIDSVQDSPYNTYAAYGLPPGPIGSPGELAIDAALDPEQHDFMFFVAWPDGSHVFSNTLAEHNAARVQARRARESIGS
jgi:UPF0755 protein